MMFSVLRLGDLLEGLMVDVLLCGMLIVGIQREWGIEYKEV
jgi:hypothetical protein